MNPVRLSKDWPVILAAAEQRELRSWKPHAVQCFVEEMVNAPEKTKTAVFVALLETLAASERALGISRAIIPFPSNPIGGDNDRADRTTGEGGDGEGDRD